ncbi:MAG: P-II family nitrogen regulator [Elusimicrobia bacterium]|nr:P-II family nitrogen regulator [Elusimicrobiota bacterium]
MKEIKAIIKPHKVEEVLHALHAIPNLPGCIVSQVKGYGRSPQSPNEDLLESDNWTKMELVVPDLLVKTVLKTIQTHAHTGQKGDGKVFVVKVADVLAIRTGKRGNEAI